MPRKLIHNAKPETLNEVFADEIASVCARWNAKQKEEKNRVFFEPKEINALWFIVASAGSDGKHIDEALRVWHADRLFRLITTKVDATLAVMLKMRKTLKKLNTEKRLALVGRRSNKQVGADSTAHAWIAKRQKATAGSRARTEVNPPKSQK